MTAPTSATEILDRHYLEVRARLLEIAATLDRIDRAGGLDADDPRRQQIAKGIEILQEAGSQRAEQLQLLFSRPYDENWRRDFQL